MSRNFRKQGERRAPRPLDAGRLDELALAYVGRFATTRAKLGDYLRRKLRERGWAEEGEPPVAAVVERLAELGYVDDAAFAGMRGAALTRRGYGERRLVEALAHAGVREEDAEPARAAARDLALEAALAFARRRRIGPFAAEQPDREGRQKALAAMLRAGHPMHVARRVVEAPPGADLTAE